jgi:hypothetical protein
MAVKYHNLAVREKKLILQKSFRMWSLCQTVFKTKQIDSKQESTYANVTETNYFRYFEWTCSMQNCGSLIRGRNWLSFASTWVHHRFLVGFVLLICLVSVLCYLFCFSSSFVLCVQCCQFVSLDCPFLIAHSVLSNVYSKKVLHRRYL